KRAGQRVTRRLELCDKLDEDLYRAVHDGASVDAECNLKVRCMRKAPAMRPAPRPKATPKALAFRQ
ncbi:MAG: hypothetical protein ACPIOQ_15795, partial [Promethearchaeia archaeon]